MADLAGAPGAGRGDRGRTVLHVPAEFPARLASAGERSLFRGWEELTSVPAVATVAEEKKVRLIANQSDMSMFAPKAQLAAVTADWSSYYIQVARAVAAGQYESSEAVRALLSRAAVAVSAKAPDADALCNQNGLCTRDAKPELEIASAELEKAAHELHEIQERWKQAAEAPRAQAQALWHRYRQAADPVQARLREFFARRNEERKVHLEQKVALIARADDTPRPPVQTREDQRQRAMRFSLSSCTAVPLT